jgi:pimeloyl-ACP methyl ester carboxylesterase
MKTIKVAPPYILIAHSYGGIVMREFLNLHRPHTNNVVGMILADTASELMYQVFSAIPEPDLVAVSDGVDFAEITHLREESKLSDEEWDATIAAMERTTKKQNANREDSRGSGLPLARKKQFQTQALDSWPLSVIRSNMANDWRIMYEAGVKAGNGTEEQRHGARGFIERFELFGDDLMAAQLRLSSQNHYVYIADCGHDFPVRRPEIIREELRWILEHLSP